MGCHVWPMNVDYPTYQACLAAQKKVECNCARNKSSNSNSKKHAQEQSDQNGKAQRSQAQDPHHQHPGVLQKIFSAVGCSNPSFPSRRQHAGHAKPKHNNPNSIFGLPIITPAHSAMRIWIGWMFFFDCIFTSFVLPLLVAFDWAQYPYQTLYKVRLVFMSFYVVDFFVQFHW